MSNILVLENEVAIGFLLKEVLGHRGHQVEVVTVGEEALRRLKEGGVDLLVSDLFLPGMGGLEVLGEMKRAEIVVPVVVISGFIDKKIGEELQGFANVTGWLRKPFDLLELLARVESSLCQETEEEGAG